MKKRAFYIFMILLLCFCSPISVFASNQDNNYTIISPSTGSDGISYSDNLLISVKIAKNTKLHFSLYKYPNYSDSNSLSEVPAIAFTIKEPTKISDDFNITDRISFYTKQVKNIDPGLYSLQIDTLDDNNAVTDTYSKYFIIKPNSSKILPTVYQSKPSKKVMFFQNVFKSLFG